MKLYLVKQIEIAEWDECESAVIAASTRKQALNNFPAIISNSKLTCKYIGEAKKGTKGGSVIHESVRNG
jgi:hypothetical protein